MAVHNIGYREWNGNRKSDLLRWTVITTTGVIRAWQNQWLRRLVLAVWIPAIWFGAGFFAWEQALENPELLSRRSPVRAVMAMTMGREVAMLVDPNDLEGSREIVWSWLIYGFMRYPQLAILVLMVAMIAPPLVSQDIRSRAFLLYFSRPLNRVEYLLGKLSTVWCYLALISIVPGLLMYVLAVLLSPSFDIVWQTWDLPLRAVAASVTMMIPTASLAVCLSSMTQESRYAAFAWFAIWVLGWFTYGIMSGVEGYSTPGGFVPERSNWALVSMYHLLNRVQSWIFGFSTFDSARWPLFVLIAITVVSLTVLLRRIAAPMRV